MSSWLPAWWFSNVNHWQEWPTTVLEEAFAFHGQNLEDKYAVENFFYEMKYGTYLEMGGHDGLTYSNTLHLHKALGWRGMLIEATPQQYAKMIANRRDDIGLLVAACDTFQDVHIVEDGPVSGIVEFMSDGFKQQWHSSVDISKLEAVPCMPLSTILFKFNVHHLDFWSLDVEGAEMQVLQTFDFDDIRVNIICVEADGHAPTKDSAIIEFLKTKGYTYHGHVERNDWFVHPDFVPSKRPHSEARHAHKRV